MIKKNYFYIKTVFGGSLYDRFNPIEYGNAALIKESDLPLIRLKYSRDTSKMRLFVYSNDLKILHRIRKSSIKLYYGQQDYTYVSKIFK